VSTLGLPPYWAIITHLILVNAAIGRSGEPLLYVRNASAALLIGWHSGRRCAGAPGVLSHPAPP
jgi:hypothetical protein